MWKGKDRQGGTPGVVPIVHVLIDDSLAIVSVLLTVIRGFKGAVSRMSR